MRKLDGLVARVVLATALVTLCGTGCSVGGGAGRGDWAIGFAASGLAPYEDPLDARQGGFGALALRYDQPADVPAAEEEPGSSPLDKGDAARTTSIRPNVRTPRPPKRQANDGTEVAGGK